MTGRVSQALAGYVANRSSQTLGYSLLQLLRGYVGGRRWRRDLHDEFRNKYGARPI